MDYIASRGPLKEDEKKRLLTQVLSALLFSFQIIGKALKLYFKDILIDSQGQIKIINPCIAALKDQHEIDTTAMAPGSLYPSKTQAQSLQSIRWSCATLLLSMLLGRPWSLTVKHDNMPANLSSSMRDLVMKIWDVDVSASEIWCHPLFESLCVIGPNSLYDDPRQTGYDSLLHSLNNLACEDNQDCLI